MSYYVLVRDESSRDPLLDGGVAIQIRNLLEEYDVTIDRLVPSSDNRKYAATRDIDIFSPMFARIRTDLRQFGFDLKGPFQTRSKALRYWLTGQSR